MDIHISKPSPIIILRKGWRLDPMNKMNKKFAIFIENKL